MENKINLNILLDQAISLWGIPGQVEIFMEESAELIQAINKYFNRKAITSDEIASEVADVELCMEQIKRMIGTEKFNNLLVTLDVSQVNYTPSECMSNCGKMINSAYLYFMKNGYVIDDLVTDMINVHLTCQHIRKMIGDDVVDKQLSFKTLRLHNRIQKYIGIEDE